MRSVFDSLSHLNLQQENNTNLYLPVNKTLLNYTLNNDNKFELNKTIQITYEDEILNFHIVKGNIVIIGKSNKKISSFSAKGELITEYTHYKKVTNSVLVEENNTYYLLFSDKFGEIYIMNISNTPFELPKILYGHSDPIHLMKMSPFNNTLISADTFGKIKVCEFPNIFNLISVILYNNEDIKYLDFLNNKDIIVLNSKNHIHLWDLFTQELKYKATDVIAESKEEEIVAIIPFAERFVYIETTKCYLVYEKQGEELKLVETVEKKETESKVFSYLFENKSKEENVYALIIQAGETGEILNTIPLKFNK